VLDKINQAKTSLEVAQNKFNHATDEDVEVATLQLMAAEAMYNRMLRIAKEEGIRYDFRI